MLMKEEEEEEEEAALAALAAAAVGPSVVAVLVLGAALSGSPKGAGGTNPSPPRSAL